MNVMYLLLTFLWVQKDENTLFDFPIQNVWIESFRDIALSVFLQSLHCY
jgi:hypothetical protein